MTDGLLRRRTTLFKKLYKPNLFIMSRHLLDRFLLFLFLRSGFETATPHKKAIERLHFHKQRSKRPEEEKRQRRRLGSLLLAGRKEPRHHGHVRH